VWGWGWGVRRRSVCLVQNYHVTSTAQCHRTPNTCHTFCSSHTKASRPICLPGQNAAAAVRKLLATRNQPKSPHISLSSVCHHPLTNTCALRCVHQITYCLVTGRISLYTDPNHPQAAQSNRNYFTTHQMIISAELTVHCKMAVFGTATQH